MGLIQTSRGCCNSGGSTTADYAIDQFEQTTNFVSGEVVLTLSEMPVSAQSIVVDWNGQILLYGISWSYASGQVTILFDDPYVEDSPDTLYFQISYPVYGTPGLTITGYKAETFLQTTNFVSGGVVLTLSEMPLDPEAVLLDWNGQRRLYDIAYSVSGDQVTILFDDPYVEDSEDPLYFQVTYPY